jgi:hypothetical protein
MTEAGNRMGIMAISINAHDTTKRQENVTDDPAPSVLGPDPHSKRLLRDHAEWHARLAMLAELRETQGER